MSGFACSSSELREREREREGSRAESSTDMYKGAYFQPLASTLPSTSAIYRVTVVEPTACSLRQRFVYTKRGI